MTLTPTTAGYAVILLGILAAVVSYVLGVGAGKRFAVLAVRRELAKPFAYALGGTRELYTVHLDETTRPDRPLTATPSPAAEVIGAIRGQAASEVQEELDTDRATPGPFWRGVTPPPIGGRGPPPAEACRPDPPPAPPPPPRPDWIREGHPPPAPPPIESFDERTQVATPDPQVRRPQHFRDPFRGRGSG